MFFWRSWATALRGASGVALAVPVGLVATVLIAVGLSSTGLGGLTQLVHGPRTPGMAGQSSRDGGLPDLPDLPDLPRTPTAAATVPAFGATRSTIDAVGSVADLVPPRLP